MSAYKKIKCEIVDKELLLNALKGLGFTPTVSETPMALRGYGGDAREQMANIIIPKEQLNKTFTGISNDLGFRWDNETQRYDMIVSDYDTSKEMPGRIKQVYAKAAIEKALIAHKFNIKSTTDNAELRARTRKQVNITAQKVI